MQGILLPLEGFDPASSPTERLRTSLPGLPLPTEDMLQALPGPLALLFPPQLDTW